MLGSTGDVGMVRGMVGTKATRPYVARVAALLVVATVGALVVACTPVGVRVTHHLDSTWSTGYQATISIKNDTSLAVPAWRLQLKLRHHVSSVWDAVIVSQDGTTVSFDHPSFAPDIAPG